MINWDSDVTEIRLNPRYAKAEKVKYIDLLNSITGYSGHVWVATSGTSGLLKFAALSKKGLLVSATSVNKHLQSDASDVWINPLPDFHVGGIGIWARSYLSGAVVVDYKTNVSWSAGHFCQILKQYKGTLTALVPTQLYDLVSQNLSPPECLRAVIIGGGALDKSLYNSACELGWPILPSYGLTECSSQVATATDTSSDLQVLSHVNVKIENGIICLKSDALLSVYAMINEDEIKLVDPKIDGWYSTEDRGELKGDVLSVFGRSSDFIKISGESVDLCYLESQLNKLKLSMGITEDTLLIATSDSRLGKVIHLMTTSQDTDRSNILVRQFNLDVLPFARIRQIKTCLKIPRTELGKAIRFME
jgi:O-succinylbenzoic acid--CoA ligase